MPLFRLAKFFPSFLHAPRFQLHPFGTFDDVTTGLTVYKMKTGQEMVDNCLDYGGSKSLRNETKSIKRNGVAAQKTVT